MDSHQPAVALYARAQKALGARPVFHRALADPGLSRAVVKAAVLFNYVVQP